MIPKTLVILSVTLMAFLGETEAKRSWGGCPKPALQSNFDFTQYEGTWFEIARDKSAPYEEGNCVQAKYTVQKNGVLSFENSLVNPKTGLINKVANNAKCDGAQCHVQFTLTYNGDYRIVSTDYTSYSVVYTCNSHLFYKDEYVWILSRTETAPSVDLSTVESSFTTETGYTFDDLYQTVQGGNCIYQS